MTNSFSLRAAGMSAVFVSASCALTMGSVGCGGSNILIPSDAAVNPDAQNGIDAGAGDAHVDGTVDSGASNIDAGLGIPGDPTDYLMTADLRDCAPPSCGGFFVQAVNAPDTLCPDGTRSATCYVAELDWAPSTLSGTDQQRATGAIGGMLLNGRIERRSFGAAGALGVLLVDGAWISEWGTPIVSAAGADFHALAQTPQLCLTLPCFNIRVDTLGSTTSVSVSDVNLAPSGAMAADIMLGTDALGAGTLRATGLMTTDTVAGPGGFGVTYSAQQFYVQLPIVTSH